jgi:HK97 family phage major capsid protein
MATATVNLWPKEGIMTKVELQLKRGRLGTEASKLLADASVLIAKSGRTKEETARAKELRAQAAQMLDDADAITEQIGLLERSDKLETHQRQIPSQNRPNPGSDDPAARDGATDKLLSNAVEVYLRFGESGVSTMCTEEERKAFARGRRDTPARSIMIGGERRDITEAGTGSYIVPQEFYPELISGKKFVGQLTGSVRKKVTAGNGAPMKIGLENDTANTITVMAENTDVTETDPTLSGFVGSTDTLATLILISKQELADSAFPLAAIFRDRLTKRYARGAENFIVNGNGSNIASILAGPFGGSEGNTFGTDTYTITATNAGPGYEDFNNCEGLLDPIYEENAAWFMHKSTRVYVAGLLDTLNRPLFQPNPQSGMLDQILGYPIKLSAYMAIGTTPSAQAVLFGDAEEGYLLRTDGEMVVQRLDERFATKLMVGFLAYTRVGGYATNAGTNPLVGLQTHS